MMQKFIRERSNLAVRSIALQILGTFLIIVFLANSHRVAYAAPTPVQPNFVLQPIISDSAQTATKSYFVLNGQLGVALLESVRVTNVGTAAGSVNIYPVSATSGQEGGIAYLSQKDPLRDVASWIEVKQPQLTLAPGQSQLVQLKIVVPSSAHPGQHMGGIAAGGAASPTSVGQGALHINVLSRTIIAVQVTIPGTTTEQMKVTGVKAGGSSGYQNLLVGMANIGDMMVSPSGNLSVKDAQGRLLQDLPLKLGIILPDTSIDYPAYLQKKALAAGDYQVSLHLNYGHGKILDYATKLTITQEQVTQAFTNSALQAPVDNSSMPLWQIIVVALAGVMILLVAGKKLYDMIFAGRRKQKKDLAPQTNSSDQSKSSSKEKEREKVS